MALFIQSFPFFRRLPKEVIEKQFCEHKFELTEYENDQILQVGADRVFVVLDGKVIMREHSLDNPFSYEILSVAKAGSILGVEYLDNGVSTSASVWSIVGSHKANFVEMSRDTFDQIWKVIITREKEI